MGDKALLDHGGALDPAQNSAMDRALMFTKPHLNATMSLSNVVQ